MSKEIVKAAPVEAPLALPATPFDDLPMQIPDGAELPEIKISRETAQFQLPNGDFTKEITGHLLFWHSANTYWAEAFNKGDGFPTCLSLDGIKPTPANFDKYRMQSPACKDCPQNQWGTAVDEKTGEPARGKACQNTIRLYVILDGDLIPCQIKVTPMGLGRKNPLEKWLFSVANDVGQVLGPKRARYQYAHVSFTLDADTIGKFAVAVIHPRTLDVVNTAEAITSLGMTFQSFKGLWSAEQVTARMVTENKGEEVGKPVSETQFVEAAGAGGEVPF